VIIVLSLLFSGIPDLDYKIGTLVFKRTVLKPASNMV